MKWRLTNETNEVLRRLYELDQERSWFGSKKRSDAISVLLREIAEKNEFGVITSMPRFLLAESPEVRFAANRAIVHLLSLLKPEYLLHLDDVSEWSSEPCGHAWTGIEG